MQLESLCRHCTITGLGNVKQVSFKPGPEDCYWRCGSDKIWQTVPDTWSCDRNRLPRRICSELCQVLLVISCLQYAAVSLCSEVCLLIFFHTCISIMFSVCMQVLVKASVHHATCQMAVQQVSEFVADVVLW